MRFTTINIEYGEPTTIDIEKGIRTCRNKLIAFRPIEYPKGFSLPYYFRQLSHLILDGRSISLVI